MVSKKFSNLAMRVRERSYSIKVMVMMVVHHHHRLYHHHDKVPLDDPSCLQAAFDTLKIIRM